MPYNSVSDVPLSKDTFLVYLIRNKVNDKFYIGYTSKSFDTRWKWHLDNAKAGQSGHFQSALRLYRKDSFNFEILSTVKTSEEAKLLEKLWIITTRSYDSEIGYNMTYGGDGLTDPSGEIGKRIGQKLKQKIKDGSISWKRGIEAAIESNRNRSEEVKAKHKKSMQNTIYNQQRKEKVERRKKELILAFEIMRLEGLSIRPRKKCIVTEAHKQSLKEAWKTRKGADVMREQLRSQAKIAALKRWYNKENPSAL